MKELKTIDENKLVKGDIYIIPEIFKCPVSLIRKGVRVFIWKLGAVGSQGSLVEQKQNIKHGCKYLSHNYWITHAENLNIAEDRLFLPYITPAKAHKGEVSNNKREALIIVNGHDPSSPDGNKVLNYCNDKDCKVRVLEGFDTSGLIEIYQKAKIVVGFCMRGSERSPIEAVLAGAVLVSNNCLAAQDKRDFPIPNENLVTNENPVENVLGRILTNFEEGQSRMGDMRTLYQRIGPHTLAEQTQRFLRNL